MFLRNNVFRPGNIGNLINVLKGTVHVFLHFKTEKKGTVYVFRYFKTDKNGTVYVFLYFKTDKKGTV